MADTGEGGNASKAALSGSSRAGSSGLVYFRYFHTHLWLSYVSTCGVCACSFFCSGEGSRLCMSRSRLFCSRRQPNKCNACGVPVPLVFLVSNGLQQETYYYLSVEKPRGPEAQSYTLNNSARCRSSSHSVSGKHSRKVRAKTLRRRTKT